MTDRKTLLKKTADVITRGKVPFTEWGQQIKDG